MPTSKGRSLLYSQPLYDTIILPAGAAGAVVGQFFAVPWGQNIAAGIAKTYAHTNLLQAGRLERGNEISINAISLYFPRTAEAGAFPTIADIDAIRAGNFRMRFGGDTDFLTLPIAALPNGGMAPVYQTDGAAGAAFTFHNGVSVTQNKLHLDEPIVLEEQETIGVTFENMDLIAAATEVQLFMWGPKLRPVR